MKKSLLIVVDERRMGGVSILLEDMLNLGVFSDYDTDILVLHNNGTRLEDVNANVIYGTKFFNTIDLTIKEVLKTKKINLIFSKVRLVFDMKTGLIKKRIVRERKKILSKRYDIEIAFKDGFTAIFTAFGDSLKKIHWLHYEYGQSNPNIKYNKLFNELLPKFDKIIAVSEGVKKAFCDFYKINDVEVIPNIVNVQKIKDLSQKNSLIKYEPGKLNVVLVGRIHPVKGYDRFLNVVKRLYDEGFKDKLVINVIGDGPDLEKIKSINNEFDLNVHFWGKMDNPYKEIKNMDLLILPSLYEAFGLVALEALILGVPVLSTKTAATEKIVSNNINGLVTENSGEGLYNGMKELLVNYDEIKEFKNNLKNYSYDIDEEIKKIKNILD